MILAARTARLAMPGTVAGGLPYLDWPCIPRGDPLCEPPGWNWALSQIDFHPYGEDSILVQFLILLSKVLSAQPVGAGRTGVGLMEVFNKHTNAYWYAYVRPPESDVETYAFTSLH